eukprot:362995-Chlamydomonas_euryale.AAC.3
MRHDTTARALGSKRDCCAQTRHAPTAWGRGKCGAPCTCVATPRCSCVFKLTSLKERQADEQRLATLDVTQAVKVIGALNSRQDGAPSKAGSKPREAVVPRARHLRAAKENDHTKAKEVAPLQQALFAGQVTGVTASQFKFIERQNMTAAADEEDMPALSDSDAEGEGEVDVGSEGENEDLVTGMLAEACKGAGVYEYPDLLMDEETCKDVAEELKSAEIVQGDKGKRRFLQMIWDRMCKNAKAKNSKMPSSILRVDFRGSDEKSAGTIAEEGRTTVMASSQKTGSKKEPTEADIVSRVVSEQFFRGLGVSSIIQ